MNTVSSYRSDPVNSLVAFAVFLLSLVVYTITLTPSVPFWDGGEYIATSYILGIPHPPGTPLYVLIGRVFSMIPVAEVAVRVNWLSAFGAAVTVFFTYLIGVKLVRHVFPPAEDGAGAGRTRVYGYVGGAIAALMAAFATTFWDNAIEAEVYSAACALMTFAVWLVLRWYERLGEGNEDGLLLAVTYLVGLGVGIHLGVAIAAWAAVVFVFVCRPQYLKRWDYLGWAIVTLSLGVGINKMTFLWAPAVLAVTLVMWLATGRLRKLPFWASIVFIVGLSVHFYMLIRAGLDPAINEGKPDTLAALWDMLIRDQYKPPPITERKTDLLFQVDHMWLRYMKWNFALWIKEGSRMFWAPPLLLGAMGAVVHVLRHRRTAVVPWVLFLFLGPAMVIYLNFSANEVRERDYFFVQNFQFMALWVGIGAIWFVDQIRQMVKSPALQRGIVGLGLAVFLGMSVLPLKANWESHDRRGFYLARDFGRNMLSTLEPNSILFTNGDNDTFSLWYVQEVEGFRKDVRVVNLSLLNTTWYIKQLRDLEPKVPMSYTDAQIDGLRPFYDRDGRLVLVKDLAVFDILRENRWQRPVYIGVTVPDQMGLDDRLVMEGLAFRIMPQPTEEAIDLEKARRMAYDTYSYEGLLHEDEREGAEGWRYNAGVHKGEGPSLMAMNNYAGILTQIALAEASRGNHDDAMLAMDNAAQVAPGSSAIAMGRGYLLERRGDWALAAQYYQDLRVRYPGDWRVPSREGLSWLQAGRIPESETAFQDAIDLAPRTFDPYQQLLSLYYSQDDVDGAMRVMQAWLQVVPDDPRIRPLFEELSRTGRFPRAEGDTTGGP